MSLARSIERRKRKKFNKIFKKAQKDAFEKARTENRVTIPTSTRPSAPFDPLRVCVRMGEDYIE